MSTHSRWILLAVLPVVLLACSSTSKPAARSESAESSSNSSASTTKTTVTTPSDPCVAGPSFVFPTWPVSGTLVGVDLADAGTAAAQFATAELGATDVRVLSAPVDSTSDCSVTLSIDGKDSVMGLLRNETGKYVVNGLIAGPFLGGSIQVSGRHVLAVFAAECTDCSTYEMHLRYGEVSAVVPAGPSSTMTVDLTGDPAVVGGYVFIARDASGAIVHASCTQIPAGDFAAS